MGRVGILVNLLAVAYQAIMIVNLLWPRGVIYDLTGHTWWLESSALLFIGSTLLLGAVYFGARQLHTKINLIHVPHTAPLKSKLEANAA